jgi:polyhydroxyalkanoate synthesis repressor PhaR
MPAERIIKKYANRRLYDAVASRHVTLDDLRKLIVQGEKVKIVDDKTGEDLTRTILLQIIADQEQFGQPILSTATLESIIRFYGDAMQGFMSRFLDQSVATFVNQQQSMQAQLSRMMSGTPLGPMADLAQHNLALWQQMQENLTAAFRGRGGVAAGGSSSAGAAGGAGSSSAPEGAPAAEPPASPGAAPATSNSTRRPRTPRTPRN